MSRPKPYFRTRLGRMQHGDCLNVLRNLKPASVDLVMTSPPFGLVKKKPYGNVHADQYLDWFRPFAKVFHRVLKDTGSLVIDIGGVWNKGLPTRHLYHFKLPIMLCEEFGFHLAQEFYWWNPAKLPTPTEWVAKRRIRVKDAVNTVWWLSKTPWPKSSNRRVLQSYSPAWQEMLATSILPKKHPSGHVITNKFRPNNHGTIPPNLLAIPNSENNSHYLRYCAEHGLAPHPARFPATLPEFFIRILTDPGDLVVDPFAGSCVTGEVAERLGRRWLCVEQVEEYLKGAVGRFQDKQEPPARLNTSLNDPKNYYRLRRPGLLWDQEQEEPLSRGASVERPVVNDAKPACEPHDRPQPDARPHLHSTQAWFPACLGHATSTDSRASRNLR